MKKKEQEKTVKGASGFSSHFFRLFFSVSFSLLFFGKRNFFFPLKSRPVRVVAEVLVHGRFLEENSEISKRKTRFFSFKMRRSMNFQMRRKQKTAVFTVRHRKCRVSSACSFFWVCVLFAVRFFFSFLFFAAPPGFLRFSDERTKEKNRKLFFSSSSHRFRLCPCSVSRFRYIKKN